MLLSFLFQAPIAEVHLSSSASRGVLVHLWDIAWLILALAVGAIAIKRRAWVHLRQWRRLGSYGDPLPWLTAVALLALVSLSWTYLTFGTSGLGTSLERVGQLIGMVILAVAVRQVQNSRNRAALIVCFVTVAAIAAAWAFAAWRWETALLQTAARSLVLHITRAGGPYGNEFAAPEGSAYDHWWVPSGAANGLGFILAVAVAVIAGYLAYRGSQASRRRLAVVAGALIVLTAGLLATQSRESWLAAVIASAVILLPVLGRRGRRVRRVLAVAVPTVALVTVLATPSLRQRIVDSFTPGTFSYRTGPQARLSAWRNGARWGVQRLPLGWGVGAIESHPRRFGSTTAENVYLQYFAELGILGLVGLLAVTVAGLVRCVKAVAVRRGETSTLYALALFIVLLTHGQFGNTLGDPTAQISLALAVGLCVPAARQVGQRSGGDQRTH